ncbi:hypothetical protein HC761_01890 [bacterium]|nr:hypothetical protein [bacterium]
MLTTRPYPAQRTILQAGLYFTLLFFSSLAIAASSYSAQFRLNLTPGAKTAQGEIVIKPGSGYVRTMKLSLPKPRYSGVSADGSLTPIAGEKDRMLWTLPSTGGRLRYTVQIENRRSNGAYDALSNKSWAIFRADKVFPKAALKAKGSAVSELIVTAPKSWHINTGYERIKEGEQRFKIVEAGRKYAAPAGWMIAGQIR